MLNPSGVLQAVNNAFTLNCQLAYSIFLIKKICHTATR